MASGQLPIPVERIERAILLLRGQKVILDADLGKLYGVSTKRLNEQIRRNQARFPKDFMFQLTREEKAEGGRKLRPPLQASNSRQPFRLLSLSTALLWPRAF